jgi:fructose-specific phosphotransferase system IIC component
MRHLLLCITLLGSLLLGSALAAEEVAEPKNLTLTCSFSSEGTIGCFLERPVFVLGNFELGIGVDSRVAIWGESRSYLSGYAIAGWYAPTWNVWAELAIPDVVPVIGRPAAFRAGVTVRF